MEMGGGWVWEVDIRSFFDELDRPQLRRILDRWFEETVKPRLRGRAFLVRFADDMVLVFANEQDTRRVGEVLPKRFARFGLRLHPFGERRRGRGLVGGCCSG